MRITLIEPRALKIKSLLGLTENVGVDSYPTKTNISGFRNLSLLTILRQILLVIKTFLYIRAEIRYNLCMSLEFV